MQVPQADTTKSKRVGVDEQFINFKSSPNFKGMKKFIRLKIDNIETSQSPSNPPDPLPPELEQVIIKPEVQLAADNLEPSTSGLEVPTKVENENEKDYQIPEMGTSAGFDQQETITVDYGPETSNLNEQESNKPPEAPIMCRDFIRGTCKRPGTCKYVHKCDPSQLFGVYTFCRNFQNKVCLRPNCKYVHATVFEEQEFYRTAKLPPHVLAPKALPPPPPPPGSPPGNTGGVEIPTSFSNPPPPLPPSLEASSSTMMPSMPPDLTDPRMLLMEDLFRQQARPDVIEHPKKKCKHCDLLEFREKFYQDKIEERHKSVNEWRRKTLEVEKKMEKMTTVLKLVGNLNSSSASSSSNSLFNSICDRKLLVEQLLKMNTNRVTPMNEENTLSGMLSDNRGLAALIAKLLADERDERGARGAFGGESSRSD